MTQRAFTAVVVLSAGADDDAWRYLDWNAGRFARSPTVQIPAHGGQSFRRIADSIPVIADSFW